MAYREVSDEEKAAVVAALLEGQSVNSVCQKFRLSRSTVIRWRTQFGIQPKVPEDTSRHIGELVAENLQITIAGINRIIERVTNDDEWIGEQGASAIATLVGVLSDKAFRTLEQVSNETEESGPDPEELG